MSDTTEPRSTTTEAIEVALIDVDPDNIRLTQPGDVEEAFFVRSMEQHGLIEPILLRPADAGRFMLIAGGRRLRGAIKLKWSRIEATIHFGLDAVGAKALQASENAHRAQMHPLDVWRAMVKLQQAGMTLTLAGQCLGLTDARARQLDRLGRLAEPLIEAMHTAGIPAEHLLARIAEAPVADQTRVFRRHVKSKNPQHILWHEIANDLKSSVIPIGAAIFDTTKARGIVWQEDFFAQPGSKAAFYTTDVRPFMKAQLAALQEQVAKRIKRGEHVELVEFNATSQYLATPADYESCYDTPKSMKLPKNDPRVLLIGLHPGGRVMEKLVIRKGKRVPKPKPRKSPQMLPGEAAASDDGDDAETAIAAPAEPPRTMTNAGLSMLAAAKTRAIGNRLFEDCESMQINTLMRLVCVACCASNVSISTGAGGYGRADMRDILARLVTPEGRLDASGSVMELKSVAAEIITRITVIAHPYGGAGAAGVIIGDAIAAADCMEPLDTEDFLKTLSATALKEAAAACDITGAKTATLLRERLQGKIGNRWRPDEAEFRPAPIAASVARDDGDPEEGAEDDDDEGEEVGEAA